MKKKNTFRKWMALFLSISMVAASGITSNVRLRAAEDTSIEETAATSQSSSATSNDDDMSTVADQNQSNASNITTTENVDLGQTGTAGVEETAPSVNTATQAETDTDEKTGENLETQSGIENQEETATADEVLKKQLDSATKTDYSYEDENVSVSAELADPHAVPDNAEFKVTQITSGEAFNAYLAALNAKAKDGQTYTAENTLLYDVAFLVDKLDESGNPTGQKEEFEPQAGTVKVSMNFKKSQLDENAGSDDIEINHLPLSDTVQSSVNKTLDATEFNADQVKVEDVIEQDGSVKNQTAEFTTDSLSVFSFTTEGAAESGFSLKVNVVFENAKNETDPNASLPENKFYVHLYKKNQWGGC